MATQTLVTALAVPLFFSSVERLHHALPSEAVPGYGLWFPALPVFILLCCAFVYVVGRLLLLQRKHSRLLGRLSRAEEGRARYRTLVNLINDLIIIIDTDGYILFSNERAESFTGRSREDLLGMSIASILAGDAGEIKDGGLCALLSDNSFNRELRLAAAGGACRWVSCRCAPLKGKDGGIDGFILTMSDIDELKEKEKQITRARDTAELGSRAKSAFLANMSHELRTPLSSILGYGQFLELEKAGALNDRQKKYLRYIITSGEHLLEMVNDVLDLAKIEAGKIRLDRKPFNVNLMLSRSPSTIKAVADKKNVSMSLNIQKNLGALNADEVRLKQVLYNLLTNAIKFTAPGRRVGLDAFAMGSTVILSVWDEGCGIAPEDQERIFLPFEQAEAHTKQGTGLGLSIVKKIVEMHGGSVSVSSVPGQGSRFTVVVPGRLDVPDSIFEQEKMPEARENGQAGKRVLVVDDNEQITELVRQVLESHGHQVIVLASGEEALCHVEEGNPVDLVFMDIGLPGTEGKELLTRIKSRLDPSVPVIALTGYAMKGDRERFLTIGFDDYVSKPFRIENMVSKVRGTAVN